jgi:hypothetical protein
MAFEKSIQPTSQAEFLKVIETGVLTSDDINNLQEFAINRIAKGDDEWLYYINLLLENDGEKFKTSDGKLSSKRKDSINLFLDYLDQKPLGLSFQAKQYKIIESGEIPNEASIGWYYYFINEAIHYCIETIFWAMLVELDGKNVPLQQFIDQIVEVVLQQTKSEFDFNESDTIFSILSTLNPTDLITELEFLEKLTKSTVNSKVALGNSFKLIFQIYINIEEKMGLITEFEKLNYLGNQKGIISEYSQALIIDSLDIKFEQYLDKVVKYVINDHISTAYRKMGNGEANLLKFIIEEGNIGHIQTMSPKFTNPRLRTLHNFLVDLGYIDKDGCLTEDGKEFLTQNV